MDYPSILKMETMYFSETPALSKLHGGKEKVVPVLN
jgi:hypothetical protein